MSQAPLFNPESMVGLSPEEIFAASRLGTEKQALQQKSLMEAMDYLYKMKYGAPRVQAETGLIRAQTAELTGKDEDRTIGVMLPNGEKTMLTPKEYIKYAAALETPATKSYQFYFDQVTASGGSPMSFFDYQKALAEAGRTQISIGDKLKEHEGKRAIDIRAEIDSPDFMAKIEKSIGPSAVTMGGKEGETEEQTKRRMVIEEMDRQIKSVPEYAGVKLLKRKDGLVGWFLDGRLIKPLGKF